MAKPQVCPFCGEEPVVEPIDWKAEGDAWAAVTCENDDCPAKPSVKNWANIAAHGAKGHTQQKRIAVLKWNNALEEHAQTVNLQSSTGD